MNTKKIVGITTALALTAAAIYIWYKHGKEQGFWYGVLALLLLGTFLEINTPNFTFRAGAPNNATDISSI